MQPLLVVDDNSHTFKLKPPERTYVKMYVWVFQKNFNFYLLDNCEIII